MRRSGAVCHHGILSPSETEPLDEKRLSIGGITVALQSRVQGLKLRLDAGMTPFLAAGNEAADLLLTVVWDRLGAAAPGPLIFDSGGSWNLHRAGEDLVFRAYASDMGKVPFAEVRVRPDLRSGEVRLHRPFFAEAREVDPLSPPLDEVLFMHLLTGKGVEMHACGIRAGGGGLLFAGQSEDGKTTTARLWQRFRPDAAILSDDRIILRPEEEGVFMYGTPWHGEADLAANLRVPLRSILLLERGEENRAIPLSRADAVVRLLARAFPPFHSEAAMTRVLETLERIVEAVPCHRFLFVPGPGAVESAAGLLGARV